MSLDFYTDVIENLEKSGLDYALVTLGGITKDGEKAIVRFDTSSINNEEVVELLVDQLDELADLIVVEAIERGIIKPNKEQ